MSYFLTKKILLNIIKHSQIEGCKFQITKPTFDPTDLTFKWSIYTGDPPLTRYPSMRSPICA